MNQSRTHNKVNETGEITASAGTNWADPAHDKAGNMTTVPKPSSLANALTLKYDAWNRLVEVKDGQTVVGKYEYDGDNRRIKKHIDSQSPGSPDGLDRYEHLFYAGVQLVETRNTTTQGDQPESLQPKYQFLWSPRYIDAPILRDENTDQDSLCDDARIYYLTDANMNVTSLVDTAGDAVERYVYDPYGKVTIYNADWSSTRSSSLYSNPCLYTGRHLDSESGLYFYRARYYSAELGRFIARDPIGYEAKDMNLYRYVGNNPVVFLDPTGLWKGGDHRALEAAGLAAIPAGEITTGCRKWMLAALMEGNNFQDAGIFGGAGGFKDNHRHYNRGPKEGREAADQAYGTYIASERDAAIMALIWEPESSPAQIEASCRNSLVAFGRLHHSYQDFFAHAILRTGGFNAWSATPPVTGTPFNRGNFWPSSYPGEHPDWGVEPVDRNSAEGRARFAGAQAFQEAQTASDLRWWLVGPCKCLCNKKK